MDGEESESATPACSAAVQEAGLGERENGGEQALESLTAVEKLCRAITDGPPSPQPHTNGDHSEMTETAVCGADKESVSTQGADEVGAKGSVKSSLPAQAGDSGKNTSDSDPSSGVPSLSASPPKLRCSKCSYVTKNKVLFDNHSCDNQDEDNDVEEQTLIKLTTGEGKKFHCSECDFWAQGHAFEEHLMCHIILRPYQCLYCSQCFVNRRDIGRHVVIHHQGMKMNCALRALKRAKGLMRAAMETGGYSFYARVAGKVPLQSDPEKGKMSKADKAKLKKSMAEAKKQPEVSGSPAQKEAAQAVEGSAECSPSPAGAEEHCATPGKTASRQAASPQARDKLVEEIAAPTEHNKASEQEGFAESDHPNGQGHSEKDGFPVDSREHSTERSVGTPATCDSECMDTDRDQPAGEEATSGDGAEAGSEVGTHKGDDEHVGDDDKVVQDSGGFEQKAQDQSEMPSQNQTQSEAVITRSDDSTSEGHSTVMNQVERPSEEDAASNMGDSKDQAETPEEEQMETGEEAAVLNTHEEEMETGDAGVDMDSLPAEGGESADPGDSQKTTKTPSPEANTDLNEDNESMGLKIVAAFSLQEEGSKDGSSNDSVDHGTNKPNFEAKDPGGSSDENKVQSADDDVQGEHQKEVVATSVSDRSTVESNLLAEPEIVESVGGSKALEQDLPARPASRASSTSSVATSFLDPPQSTPSSSPYTSSQVTPLSRVSQKNCFFFICGFGCNFSCLTSPEFRDHLILDHPGECSFACYHCGFQSHSEDGLVRHITAHSHTYSKAAPLYICGASACKFGSNLVGDFTSHLSSWHPDLTSFHCHDCDEQFWTVQDLLKHFDKNFLHILNCPHCTAKTTERRALLNHIASAHPGKPKMVSVAKQIICRDRRINCYAKYVEMRDQFPGATETEPPAGCEVPAKPPRAHTSDSASTSTSRNKSLVSILTEPIQPQERELARAAGVILPDQSVVKSETVDDDDAVEDYGDDSGDDEAKGQGPGGGDIAFLGSKSDDKDADNFKCRFCTFIARDRCRLEGHEKCHGLPPARKARFKCMYCPQGFNNEHKFSSHVSCHPGLIKFSLFCCKRCEFDSNQRHIIQKHVRNTRDQAHMSYGSNEDDMYAVLNKSLETRVMECRQCSYMTRHRKHLVLHIKREHASPLKTGITVDRDIVEKYPSESMGANRTKALEMALSHDRSASLPVGDDGNIRENQARRFKCPICQYLVPRAADLKAHVKRHSEIGEITLVMFRCKYCSAASTAREIIYGHLMEKHLGKQIALVKRIVTIDTKGGDNNYAVTSMEDEEVGTDAIAMGQKASDDGADKMVLLIPDSAGETFQTAMQCPCCPFASYNRKTIIQHVANHHPEVSIMGRRQGTNEVYPLEVSQSSPAVSASAARITLGEALKGDILIVPDNQTFDEPVRCPKCEFVTIQRKQIVQHLEKHHPDVSVMGRNDYPTFEGKSMGAAEANALGKDGMVIIGSGSLDEKIRCLYENYGDKMKCMICQTERPKKFFIHVHILRHLNILLWKCMYCNHKGLQKYKMMDHIKKVHPGLAVCVRYLPVNVEEKVNEYLRNASMIRARRSGEEPGPECSTTPTTPPRASPLPSSYRSPPVEGRPKSTSENLNSCTIGSEELDMKLACLYALGEGNRFRCVVCGQEFQRKFAVHRHIVQAHLKVNLIGCGYCELEGVERHIMMDHIIETHKNAPISMRNLAHDLENRVSDFLAKMTLDAEVDLELPASDIGMDDDFTFKLPEPPQLPSMLPPLESASPPPRATPPRTPPRTPSPSTGKNQLKPNLLLLGRDLLHSHLKALVDESKGGSFKCLVCSWEFPRKYPCHRHILMKHLKVGIIGCPYCSFEGVERYQVFSHIREEHKDSELSLRYLAVDMDKVVGDFVSNLASGKDSSAEDTLPPWSVRKPVKAVKMEVPSDVDEEEREKSADKSGNSQGLVVAMFSKKSVVKQEPVDDEDAYGAPPVEFEGAASEDSRGEMDNLAEDNSMDYDLSEQNAASNNVEVQSMSLMAANGTKGKSATDVLTSIRVITIKEKGFKRHVCEKCKFTSLHRSNIVRHIYRVHEQYREQECPVCNYKTLSKVLIQQHMKNEHPGSDFPEELFKPLKRKSDQTIADLESAAIKRSKAAAVSRRRDGEVPVFTEGVGSSSQLYACAYCSFETQTHADIVQHTRDNHSLSDPMQPENKEEPIEAGEDTDDTEFETLDASAVKMNQVDLSNGIEDCLLQCSYCAYKTTDEVDLRTHCTETHVGMVFSMKKVPAWRFVCRHCNVKTRAHSKMRYHLNRHINYRPYTCATCGSLFASPDQCRKHCRHHKHNDAFTYNKNPKKERRLQELLKECQEIAMALSGTASESEPAQESSTTPVPIPSKRKAKKSFSSSLRGMPGRVKRPYELDTPYKASTSREDRQRDEEAQMVCASCDFTAQNVCEVWLHFIQAHEGQEFQWMDMNTGHICTETGEITNAKDVPPDFDAPAGLGFDTLDNKLLSCTSCEFVTATVQAMKSHLRRHMPKRFLCPYCSLRCGRSDTISQHVRSAHRGREFWTIHFRLPPGFTADTGEDNVDTVEHQFETVNETEVVLPTRSVNVERIKCGHCDFKQACVASVQDHCQQEHPGEEFRWVDMNSYGYTCTESGEVLDAKELMPDLFTDDGFTVESNGSVPTFVCRFCNRQTAFIQAMKSHMKSHLPHGFMCPYCNASTNSRDKMISHVSSLHRDRPKWVLHLRLQQDSAAAGGTEKMGVTAKRPVTGVTNYWCNLCEYSSENLYQYRLHLAHHGTFTSLTTDLPDNLPFKCGYCVYVAEDEGDFGAHIASHLERRDFRCSKCEYTAFKRSGVVQHIQSAHAGEQSVEVIDLQATNVSEQGGSVEEPKLVNFDPKVLISPVTDEDLEKENLVLYTPPSTPERRGGEVDMALETDSVDMQVPLSPASLSMRDLDDASDSTEEWGKVRDDSRESTPVRTWEATTIKPGSLLRLTLQGRISQYGYTKSSKQPSSGMENDDDDDEASDAHESEQGEDEEDEMMEDGEVVDVVEPEDLQSIHSLGYQPQGDDDDGNIADDTGSLSPEEGQLSIAE